MYGFVWPTLHTRSHAHMLRARALHFTPMPAMHISHSLKSHTHKNIHVHKRKHPHIHILQLTICIAGLCIPCPFLPIHTHACLQTSTCTHTSAAHPSSMLARTLSNPSLTHTHTHAHTNTYTYMHANNHTHTAAAHPSLMPAPPLPALSRFDPASAQTAALLPHPRRCHQAPCPRLERRQQLCRSWCEGRRGVHRRSCCGRI
jgi:hypothetical protein